MRYLTDHLTTMNLADPLPDGLEVIVVDEPGAGGANHEYMTRDPDSGHHWKVSFQCGTIKEAGVNGVTHEALLAILIDRLRSFQAGPFPCEENRLALEHLEAAIRWLHHRTRNRMLRGVEGEQRA